MIERLRTPPGWDAHHTLYYRRWYLGKENQRLWRNNSAMIVPMRDRRHPDDPYDDHRLLHDNVPPLSPIASDALAGYALHVCDELNKTQDRYTRLEAFTEMRNEMRSLSRKRAKLELGREAARFTGFFDQQLGYMIELPHS